MAAPFWNSQSDHKSEVPDLQNDIAPALTCEARRSDAAVKVEDGPQLLKGEGVEVVHASSRKRGGLFRDSLAVERTRQCRERPECVPIGMQAEDLRSSLFVDDNEATRRQAPYEGTTMERPHPSYPLLEKLVVPLQKGDPEYQDVERKFLGGLGQFASSTVVTGISRNASARGQVRLQAFEKLKDMTRKARGDENERFAWHGTSKAGVSGIFLHGFGQPRTPKNGSAYGVGVYLAPEGHSHVSAVYADDDENNEQHIVLCKVILGASELVAYGSDQFHPSSDEYDTGVDDLVSPRRLIVWSTHMNTHILPLYVVSFRLPSQWHNLMAAHHGKKAPTLPQEAYSKRYHAARQQKFDEAKHGTGAGSFSKQGPTSPFIYFPHLFLLLSSLLAPEKLQFLKNCHREFQARRLTRPQLIQHLRSQVGDHCLVHAIKLLQGSQMPKRREQIKCKTSISFTAREEMKCETPLSFTAAEKIGCETPLSSTAAEKVECKTPLAFTAAKKIEFETPVSFTVGEKVKCEVPLSFTAFETRSSSYGSL